MSLPNLPVLPPVTAEQHAAIQAAPRTEDAHRALLAGLPALNAVQRGGTARADILPAEVSVVAWNLERCLFPEASARHLAPRAPDLVLLSEMDHGMARTGQRHTTQAMAAELGMAYAYGVEFHELDLGGETERAFCRDDANTLGWHGNAILSAAPMQRVTMIRLDDHGHWFLPQAASDPGQPRVGGRMALIAVIDSATGPICAVSTHLESNAQGPHRAAQFDRLMDAVDDFAPGLPVIIGGDLNTGNHVPPDFDWRAEALFDRARARGYDWAATPEGMTTRPSLITRHPDRVMKLDWFCTRGLRHTDSALLPAITDQGTPLSDHEAIATRIHR